MFEPPGSNAMNDVESIFPWWIASRTSESAGVGLNCAHINGAQAAKWSHYARPIRWPPERALKQNIIGIFAGKAS